VRVRLVQQLWSRLELHLLLTVLLDSNRKYATNTSYQVIIHNQQVMLHLTLHNSSSIYSINKQINIYVHTYIYIHNKILETELFL